MMRQGLQIWCAAAVVMGLAGTTVRAQTVPPQFVVSGAAAEKIQDFTTINLATAERLAELCQKAVTARGDGAHSIVILDNDGNHVYVDRMDGQQFQNVITAEYKARTALKGRVPSKTFMNRVQRDEYQELPTYQLGFYPVAGGLPIVVNKQMIGAIGGGGYPPNPPVWSDEMCVRGALVEVFGPSVPPLLEDIPRQRHPFAAPRFAAAAAPKTTLPQEFVVRGQAAAHIFDANQISLAAAKKIARACRDSLAAGGRTMATYVLNNAGDIVHMERMDGQVATDIQTALLKAQTSLRRRQPTSIEAAMLKANPEEIARSSAFWRYYSVPGGIPIVVDGQMIGAVGVTVGANAGGDEECAIAGLKATFGDRVLVPTY